MTPTPQRAQTYFEVSAQLARMDSEQVLSRLSTTEPQTGWGRNQTITVGETSVFVKRIPMTNTEYDNLFSTKNLYDLPTYYNYGVGSAGLGIFRELVAHLKTTHWVLNGEIETFPLLYHYRILPYSGTRAPVDQERHQSYVEYWGGDANIGRYRLDRANATSELVLFLEYVPQILQPWLEENPDRVPWVLEELRATVAFLRQKGMVHFDAHFYNILTDGERIYLTDFGLVLDKSFLLTKKEAAFFNAHTHYDYGEVLSGLSSLLYQAYRGLSEEAKCRLLEKLARDADIPYHELVILLLEQMEVLQADGFFKLDETYAHSVVTYRSLILLMHRFYSSLQHNNRKDTPFPHVELKRQLKAVGFL